MSDSTTKDTIMKTLDTIAKGKISEMAKKKIITKDPEGYVKTHETNNGEGNG